MTIRSCLPTAAILCLVLPEAGAAEDPTFNRDVAPIVFSHCVSCHHPGGAGPFSLTTYREVRKRAQQIQEVTSDHSMPPWLPEPGHGDFVGKRRLDPEQVATLARWAESGAAEGNAGDLKVKPTWNDGWQLGQPDLIVTMPAAYTLPADGHDVYRNFVIPSPVTEDRHVVAVEVRPANAAVHHAFVKFDRRGSGKRLDAKDVAAGYLGMNAGAGVDSPAGTFASWQPGEMPGRLPPELAWVFPGQTDIVLQMHMRPSGKPEKVQASIGFYFTKEPPTRIPFVFCIRSTSIDVPAGATEHPVQSSYTLPVDGAVLALLPHLHYLGKEAHAWATLPDGTKRELILIKKWDFSWQGTYRYEKPVPLPKGTVITMRYTYDNSAGNVDNPNQPPVRVRFGLESTDEMGELWLQFLPDQDADMALLQRDYVVTYALPDEMDRLLAILDRNPRDAASRAELAAMYRTASQPDRARLEAEQALADDPNNARAHSVLGHYWIDRNALIPARTAFEAVVGIDPDDADAQNNLGFLLTVEGRPEEAIVHLEKAIALNPKDDLARQNLEKARAQLKK